MISALDQMNVIPARQNDDGLTVEQRAAQQAEEQQQDFLQLLLTQITNQNPLDPMDTSEFTAQVTRYSQLEQQLFTNEKLTVTNDLLRSSADAAGFTYIGQDVEVSTDIGVAQNGEAKWSYSVEGLADEVAITILDDNGAIVYQENGQKSVGAHALTVNTAELGVEDGSILYLAIAARDKDGGNVDTRTSSFAKVDGLWSDGSETFLTAGQVSFRTSDVLKVFNQSTTTPNTNPNNNNNNDEGDLS